jgi:hypothetical protein
MTPTLTRLAAILLAAVLCADLAGADCGHHVTGGVPCSSPSEPGDSGDTAPPDCLCCLAAVSASETLLAGDGAAPGRPFQNPPSTPTDGVRPVPYRPPVNSR